MQIAVPKNNAFAGYGVSVADESVLEADAGDVMWDEIEEIRVLDEEQVWDIEVEGTHNFVAGHLFDKKTGNQLSEKEEQEWISGVDGGGAGLDASSKKAAVCYGGIFAHNTYLDGSVGIGTATPNAKLSIFDQTSELRDAFTVATSTDGNIFRVDTAGDAFAQGSFNSGGADYAEHFYADTADLVPGEVVCVSLENENAVARCIRPRDGNVMGIVSTNPAIIGNTGNIAQNRSVVVGMLGQVPARVTNENGEIRPGDSLTPASVAGYAMKADGGDPTVGVALERLNGATGTVRVLISRRNKSLTVEQVEEAVVDRIAAMEIEDEVALLVSDAVSGYNFDPVVSSIIGGELALLEEDFNLLLTDEINELRALIASQELQLIEELVDLVAINTNLTVSGSLEASGGLVVPYRHPERTLSDLERSERESNGGAEGYSATTTPAFSVSPDGTVTAFNDFIISDGVNATSVKETLAALGAEDMTRTNLTVKQDLYVGNSFEVMGAQVAGASVQRPVFRVAADGAVTVRDDLVLSGYDSWNDIPGIVSVVVYDTTADADGGAWVAGNRSASWYNEALDASASACDSARDSRCGTRSFPNQSIIAATSDTVYIFNARDGSLWKKRTDVGSGITAVTAADGVVYVGQSGVVSALDFAGDTTASLAVSSNSITGIHSQRINGRAYVAVSGDAGIDLITTDNGSSSHYAGAATDVWLTEAGDLYATATNTLSVFARAHLSEALAPTSSYTVSSTEPLIGLYVSSDGSTAYTASGSEILKFTYNRHPEPIRLRSGQAGVEGSNVNTGLYLSTSQVRSAQDDGLSTPVRSAQDDVLTFTVDEAAQAIYIATETGVTALAIGDGSVLAEYSQPGASIIASLTRAGSAHEGDMLSDTLVIATADGFNARGANLSVRQGLAAFGAQAEQSGRLRVTNEAVFSGRLTVTDSERTPLFAVDEQSGDVLVREDVQFAADSRMRSIPGVASVFAYDTTQDSDGGVWRSSVLSAGDISAAVFGGAFPQQAILTAAGAEVRVYDARAKSWWGAYSIEAIPSITGIAARGGTLAVYGDAGMVLVDLATGQETGFDSSARSMVSLVFSEDQAIYYATENAVYKATEQIPLFTNEILTDGSSDSITSIAFSGDTLYVGHSSGITGVRLATGAITTIDVFADIVSISSTGSNTLLVAYGNETAEISESGQILDRWTTSEERQDSFGLPYSASRVFAASASNGVRAIALEIPSGDRFVWMETSGFSLRDALHAPKNVFTVIDRLQTPRISSVANLSFTASSTISFYAGATSTPALVVRPNGDISTSGNVGIGTTTPQFMLDVAGDARFGATEVAGLRVNGGYLQMDTVNGTPPSKDCANADAYGRMALDASSDTLYLCGSNGWRAFAEQPVETAATTTPETVSDDTSDTATSTEEAL
ncbi:hypothetical protein BK004_02870 [bacterium CG10_46_32]|nr:MAG: hypothetical protein BK004_02870 [bacterium CG10_46_32]PIR56043.1 MAG: hypothetical protein COU73_02900 [Parcubacteria group bacterium CG10_big_fil_rev_8_21_14_0_10_46_32]